MKRTIKIRPSGTIISGASYAFRSRAAAMVESRRATTDPGTIAYYDPRARCEVYLGRGETSADDRSVSLYGRKGRIVAVVEVAA